MFKEFSIVFHIVTQLLIIVIQLQPKSADMMFTVVVKASIINCQPGQLQTLHLWIIIYYYG